MFVSACEARWVPYGFWGGGVPNRKVLGVPRPDCEVSGFDLDQLGPTLFCIE